MLTYTSDLAKPQSSNTKLENSNGQKFGSFEGVYRSRLLYIFLASSLLLNAIYHSLSPAICHCSLVFGVEIIVQCLYSQDRAFQEFKHRYGFHLHHYRLNLPSLVLLYDAVHAILSLFPRNPRTVLLATQ